MNGSRGRAASREARGKVADYDVRSGASCACAETERTPKLSNERSIETDSPTDLERAAVREGAAPRTNRALERRSCIAYQTRETGLTQGRLAESGFLEKCPVENFCCRVHRKVILKVRRTIFSHDFTVYATAPHSSFLTWIKVVFPGRSSAGSPAGSGRTTPATWSTPRRGACSVPRNHPTLAPSSPARRQAAEVKVVECITIAHGIAQRLSEKWRHFACKSVVLYDLASRRS